MSCIFLLAGWGLGEQCLIPLADKLTEFGHDVILKDLPYLADDIQWLEALDEQLPESSYWVGWSLGGQLLSHMTTITKKHCLGLITLGSNASFTMKEDWPCAMDKTVFNQFQQSYLDAPKRTIKRFKQLVVQGCLDPKLLITNLQQPIGDLAIENVLAGLALLANLDTRTALKKCAVPQYHLFAEKDALVPISCATKLKKLLPQTQIEVIDNSGHAFVIQEPQIIANKINQFIKANQ